jgi:hypothetical protein
LKNGFSKEESAAVLEKIDKTYRSRRITATCMRPITTTEESSLADDYFCQYIYDPKNRLDELVPGEKLWYESVAIAEDGSCVEFEVYDTDDRWPEKRTEEPIGRIMLVCHPVSTVEDEDVVA